MMKEQLQIADLCQRVGFTIEAIKQLLRGITIPIHSGKLYSPEYDQRFEVKDAQVKIEKEPDYQNKLRLNLNGMNILEWFEQKFKELDQLVNIRNGQRLTKQNHLKI
jgi:hypothetical protein